MKHNNRPRVGLYVEVIDRVGAPVAPGTRGKIVRIDPEAGIICVPIGGGPEFRALAYQLKFRRGFAPQ